jgi:coenzyme PQQ biosynthesis protein PqqD
VLPGVRFACDAYVELVRERTLVEAVASSLTEFFAPDLMSKRVLAWEKHYPWVSPEMLAYSARACRAPGATRGGHRLRHRARDDLRDAGALRGRPHPQDGDPLAPARLRLRRLHRAGLGSGRSPRQLISTESRPRLAAKAASGSIRKSSRYMLLYPERGLVLNPTAADVLQRCDGQRTVGSIVEELARQYGHEVPSVEREVMTFLQTMADRGLVQAAV